MSAQLEAAREASPNMEWEEEREGKRRMIVGVTDAFTPREVVIRLEWVRVAGGEGRWSAWLRSAKGRGGCNLTAYGDTIEAALDEVRRRFREDLETNKVLATRGLK